MTEIEFVTLQPEFAAVTGKDPRAKLVAETDSTTHEPLFHEACVYVASSRSVYVTSNCLTGPDGAKHIRLSKITDCGAEQQQQAIVEDVTPAALAKSMLNGGVNYGRDGLLMCAQGGRSHHEPSGIVQLSPKQHAGSHAYDVRPLVSRFHDLPLNSVNDVVVHPHDGSIWFTDPPYGHHQGFRPPPQLPAHVYRFEPSSGSIRALADGFLRPNGLCFSPDLETLYVTDTGAIHGSCDVPFDHAGPSHIYAFDVVEREGGVFLTGRRLFAYAPGKLPDGIKCDLRGNVYSGCMDGVEVWNPRGDLIGLVRVPGGVANFCFGEKGAMYLCNETRLWKVQLDEHDVRGALLGL